MSTYLVCIVVGEFERVAVPTPSGAKTIISLYATERQVKNLEYMKEFVVRKTQKWFDDHIKSPYKEPKIDHIALPGASGAMENWGLITYGEDNLCIDKETSSIVGKFNGVTFVAHELAHMCYGNLVTCRWWNDLWIQEGFATFYSYKATQYLDWNWMLTQLSELRRGVQSHMSDDQKLSTTLTVRTNISTPKHASSAFNKGSYNKGGAMVRMIHGILTTKVAERAFAKFVEKFAYSNARTKDLMYVLDNEAVLAKITHPDNTAFCFNNIFQQWLNIKGFPVVSASKLDSYTINLQQKIYLSPSGQQIPPKDKTIYSWEIPINLVTNLSPMKDWDGPASDWIHYKSKDQKVYLPPSTKWYILNPRQYYYYRVQYDHENVKALITELKTNLTKISPETRSNLLDDYFDFSRTMMESIEYAMDFTYVLELDPSYNPWQVALKHAHDIEPFISTQPYYNKFQLYFIKKLDKLLEKLSYNFPDNEPVSTTFLRKDAIASACSFGSEICLKFSREQYAKYINNPDVNSMDANVAPTVLCVGVFEGDTQDFETIKQQYIKRRESQSKDERHAYMFAITCTKNENKLESIFQDILECKTFIDKDINQAAQYLASTSYGAKKLFDYIDENWNKTMSFNKRTTMTTITNKWHTQDHVKKIDDFIMKRESDTVALSSSNRNSLVLNQLQVKDNHNFYLNQTSLLGAWLDRNFKSSLKQQSTSFSSPGLAYQHWSLLNASYHENNV